MSEDGDNNENSNQMGKYTILVPKVKWLKILLTNWNDRLVVPCNGGLYICLRIYGLLTCNRCGVFQEKSLSMEVL